MLNDQARLTADGAANETATPRAGSAETSQLQRHRSAPSPAPNAHCARPPSPRLRPVRPVLYAEKSAQGLEAETICERTGQQEITLYRKLLVDFVTGVGGVGGRRL